MKPIQQRVHKQGQREPFPLFLIKGMIKKTEREDGQRDCEKDRETGEERQTEREGGRERECEKDRETGEERQTAREGGWERRHCTIHKLYVTREENNS